MNEAQRTKAGEVNSLIWKAMDGVEWIKGQGINAAAGAELDVLRALLMDARAQLDAAVKASQ